MSRILPAKEKARMGHRSLDLRVHDLALARCRCHPSLPPAKSRPMSVVREYERGGALQYLAA